MNTAQFPKVVEHPFVKEGEMYMVAMPQTWQEMNSFLADPKAWADKAWRENRIVRVVGIGKP